MSGVTIWLHSIDDRYSVDLHLRQYGWDRCAPIVKSVCKDTKIFHIGAESKDVFAFSPSPVFMDMKLPLDCSMMVRNRGDADEYHLDERVAEKILKLPKQN